MHSKMFTSLDLAVNACPTKKDLCGARYIDNFTATTGATISASGLGPNDSCSYLIETKCDYPEVEITSNTLASTWNLDFIEFQEGNATMMTDTNLKAYPALTSVPKFIPNYSGLGGVMPFMIEEITKAKFPSEKFTTVYKNKYPVSRIVGDLDDYNKIIAKYATDVDTYNKAKAVYDAEVVANQASYDKNKKEYDERSGFTCLFGCEDQKWDEVVAKKPTKPTVPAAYTGYVIGSLKVEDGLGAMITGSLDMSSKAISSNKIKAFGIHGQVAATGKGFTKAYDTTSTATPPVKTCKSKTLMLTLYPTLKNTATTTGGFGAKVSRGAAATLTLKANKPVATPTDPKSRLDEKKMWEFRVLADKAVTLAGATACALSLAALTLY